MCLPFAMPAAVMALALASRVSLKGTKPPEAEDFLSAALGFVFPGDAVSQHGDADHSLIYESPHLPKGLHLELADPASDVERRLFSHYLWNSSLLLAELIERDTLGISAAAPSGHEHDSACAEMTTTTTTPQGGLSFDIRGKSILELGAGTALPSIMSGLLGAQRIVVTDYPAPFVMQTLRENIARNIRPEFCPVGFQTTPETCIAVEGHSWGDLPASDRLCESNRHAFDRVIVADCLWMPWQHQNLHRSIDHFLKRDPEARCWVVAAFHTGRDQLKSFFAEPGLRQVGLEVERIWERDVVDGQERAWSWDVDEDVTARKRWLVVSELRRIEGSC